MRRVMVLVAAVLLLAALGAALQRNLAVARFHRHFVEKRIYAYRDWQSSGVRIDLGDRVKIEAKGSWSYTPGEYHGPEGHAVYLAPRFYPIPQASGGVLTGRIGEKGQRFVIGKATELQAQDHGILFLRINDDILTDNGGWVAVQIDSFETEELLP